MVGSQALSSVINFAENPYKHDISGLVGIPVKVNIDSGGKALGGKKS
jgi:hypothetical protein